MSQKSDKITGKLMYYGAYVDSDGVKHQYKKHGFKSQREARKAEDKSRDEIDYEKITVKSRKFKKLCEEYLIFSNKSNKTSSHISNIEVTNKICISIGDIDITKLNQKKLQDYIDELDVKYAYDYVKKIYYTINKVLIYAVTFNYLVVNPLTKVKMNSRKNEIKKEIKKIR